MHYITLATTQHASAPRDLSQDQGRSWPSRMVKRPEATPFPAATVCDRRGADAQLPHSLLIWCSSTAPSAHSDRFPTGRRSAWPGAREVQVRYTRGTCAVDATWPGLSARSARPGLRRPAGRAGGLVR
jgi:hypothetical protein